MRQCRILTAVEKFSQRFDQIMHIRCRQIEPLGPGGRHDMCGIADQEQSAKTQRFRDKTAQRRDAFLERWPGGERSRGFRVQPTTQFCPEGVISPIRGAVIKIALQIVAAAGFAAHAAKRKAARMADIDQFMINGGHISQKAKPAKGIDFFIKADGLGRYAGTANAVKAIAAGNHIASQFMHGAVGFKTHFRVRWIEIQGCDVFCLVNGEQPRSRPCLHQVTRDFRLAIDRDGLAARMAAEVNALPHTIHTERKSVMHQAFCLHARANTRLLQKLRRGLFNHAGANAPQHVICAALFKNNSVYPRLVQQLAKQQPGRTGPNNRNLGTRWKTHDLFP